MTNVNGIRATGTASVTRFKQKLSMPTKYIIGNDVPSTNNFDSLKENFTQNIELLLTSQVPRKHIIF